MHEGIEDVYDQFEITRQRIRDIEKRALRKLKTNQAPETPLKCSFCGKEKCEVKKLVESRTSPGVYICDECVRISLELIRDD